MVTKGLFIRVEAKPDKVAEVEERFKQVVEIVRKEGKAVAWFALRLGPTTFAIYDAFRNDADRQAHLDVNGPALRAAGAELFAEEPTIQHIEVVASLLPGQ
ncbi:putative quinol monooxygenase [Actinomadura opuntiae]|uniref:putative quinol monooxygenase n=1 Tax=Actinomadura sp. OS1-43 TaxID=604315 RepID=UPI00255AAE62|nr:antibiotic biosynthesis monooxygenase [Actinomadura sp. OS1-43]MDL4814111.1 antibiotic biosynthesis monooxygenase [Actinomadura sp. OS1-43]